ncbi:MAG: chemotaxis-specific protein-glutamate methyltransferase CheB [Mariprofundaceae bacterium]|nr:chemotaxis-specific protein-glutamate methyltransferase CheB [Mariprofundaceae bacterium]
MSDRKKDKIRLLIVDDSVVFRTFFRGCIAQLKHIELVGVAKDGRDALNKIKQLKPDVVTMDMEMPHFHGIEVIECLQDEAPDTCVLVISSQSETNAEKTVKALAVGAFDFVLKPKSSERNPTAVLLNMLKETLPRARSVKRVSHAGKATSSTKLSTTETLKNKISQRPRVAKKADLVAIGSSTGGPAALYQVLSRLPANFSLPITVTQHMPKLFLQSLADRLDRDTSLKAKLAEDGMVLEGGCIYVAPGDVHMEIERMGTKLCVKLVNGEKVHHCRPAVDVTFHSLVKLLPRTRCVAVVLTGMGADGAAGAKAMRDKQAYVIAQDEKSSVVWGMPGETVKCGAANEVLPLMDIAAGIIQASGG